MDSGFSRTCDITHFYDPLLAKLIVHAEDRPAAIKKMQGALREFIIHGVATNIDFMQAVLAHADFAKGLVTTRWAETKFRWKPPDAAPPEALIAAALADMMPADGRGPGSEAPGEGEADPFSPWKQGTGFRN